MALTCQAVRWFEMEGCGGKVDGNLHGRIYLLGGEGADHGYGFGHVGDLGHIIIS